MIPHYLQSQSLDSCDSVEFKRAYGCIAGAFIGDAAGAVLEFQKTKITQKEVERAVTFPGGGVFDFEPGEITDDSEMALCLLNAILKDKGHVNPKTIGEYYCKWKDSNPKDIGITTTKAIEVFKKTVKNYEIEDIYKAIARATEGSKSNGCLMRITPLAVLCRSKSDEEILEITKRDVRLTHSDPT